jgi:hypothetical protein
MGCFVDLQGEPVDHPGIVYKEDFVLQDVDYEMT